ncbi:hypothetical protein ACOTHJ_15885 [Achromobacter xylosoxidans]|uniref:hypothetical protein n=1 Tax=Achromobacter anxifer TaxID=1287737 RepID=UPI00155D1A54|nr:hypothetical protein [Achromobacter anxifer]CAB5514476.1 hypothetical protein LMG26857_03535 [Achromobacter anxifer]
MATTKNPCTLCGKPGIPGLIAGAGKCQYHYNVGQFGREWADRVKASDEVRELARVDAEKAQEHGVDINPFSTDGARHRWQQGWNGEHPELLVVGSTDWRQWERGRQARILHDTTPNAVC